MIKKFNQYLNESEGTLTQEQKDWLNENTDGTWRVNPSTGLVDVDGDFDCSNSGIKTLQGVRFGVVSGDFFCSYNQLTSLEGAPQEVGEDFNCYGNKLTSLKGAPQKVGEDFKCFNNQLTSLKGIPFVNGDIDIEQNPIRKLISPYWKQIEGMETGSRNLVMQMIGRLENPTAEDIARIMRSIDRMDMI